MRISDRDKQRVLAAAGYYEGEIDGIVGPKTRSAAATLLTAEFGEVGWIRDRMIIAATQVALKRLGHDPGDIDGFVGPRTQYALESWKHQSVHGSPLSENWRPDDHVWPDQRDMTKFYGRPGGPQCTAGKVTPPFPMIIAWNRRQTISHFSCHEMVADSAERVYRKIFSAYSVEDISRLGFDLFGGCYNYRKKRGGSTLSTHAYGAAIDTDPERNQLRWGRDRAFLASHECEEFWRIWESEGWVSLGRALNFDWMHVQAARL